MTVPSRENAPKFVPSKDHRLYILMRTDMASMNPGKACAQATHAGQKFAACMKASQDLAYTEWCESAGVRLDEGRFQGFGTTLTLSCDEVLMYRCVEVAKENGLAAGIVFDPTYPLRDGDYTHYLPIDTCGYIFVPEHLTCQVPELLSTLDLMK